MAVRWRSAAGWAAAAWARLAPPADGRTRRRAETPAPAWAHLTSLAAAPSGLVAMGSATTLAGSPSIPAAWLSADGSAWSRLADMGTLDGMVAVYPAETGFVALGVRPTDGWTARAWRSSDGRSWSSVAGAAFEETLILSAGSWRGRLVAVGVTDRCRAILIEGPPDRPCVEGRGGLARPRDLTERSTPRESPSDTGLPRPVSPPAPTTGTRRPGPRMRSPASRGC